jgi:hypothetical protein
VVPIPGPQCRARALVALVSRCEPRGHQSGGLTALTAARRVVSEFSEGLAHQVHRDPLAAVLGEGEDVEATSSTASTMRTVWTVGRLGRAVSGLQDNYRHSVGWLTPFPASQQRCTPLLPQ